MRFVKEDGRWKIKDQAFSDKAYPAESVYAILPPAAGAFERAGAPWQNDAPAFDKAEAARHGWQVRAASDESFFVYSNGVVDAHPCARQPGGKPAHGMAGSESRRF